MAMANPERHNDTAQQPGPLLKRNVSKTVMRPKTVIPTPERRGARVAEDDVGIVVGGVEGHSLLPPNATVHLRGRSAAADRLASQDFVLFSVMSTVLADDSIAVGLSPPSAFGWQILRSSPFNS
jgi:hypothetical protein